MNKINEKLLTAIPTDATRILEFNTTKSNLYNGFKSKNPSVYWHTINIEENNDISTYGENYDVIIFDNVLENIENTDEFLKMTFDLCNPTGKLICCIKNMAHINIIQHLLGGDISDDNISKKFLSISSSYKLLLNAGWLPNLKDNYSIGHESSELMSHLRSAAKTIGISNEACTRNIFIDQFIVDCVKKPSIDNSEKLTSFSVVVAVNRPSQFNINVLESPGLKEVNAQIIQVSNAKNAADALENGKKEVSNEWILYCHQDVYFPVGSGIAIAKMLASVKKENINRTIFGFGGLNKNELHTEYSGLVIDRTSRFDFDDTNRAISIDELAVIISKDSIHEIDSTLGWHCWGTDLCLTANHRKTMYTLPPKIVRIPVFHNSYGGHDLSEYKDYEQSAKILKNKYPELSIIQTLNGDIK